MSDHDFADLARRACDRVSVSPAPVAAIRQSAERRRGRPAWVVGAAAASVLAVAGGIAVVGSGDRPGAAPPSAPSSTPTPSDAVLPTPPTGTRWWGVGDVMIAIPADWDQSEIGCASAPTGSVVEDFARWHSTCAALSLDPLPIVRTTPLGQAVIQPTGVVTVPVPSVGRQIVVQAPDVATARAIAASATAVPAGLSVWSRDALPLGGAMPRGGFSPRVTVDRVPSDYAVGTLLRSDPPLGTPLAPQAPVTVTVSAGRDQPAIGETRLARRGFTLTDTDESPGFSRSEMLAHLKHRSDGKIIQLYLRRVTSTDSLPDEIQDRLLWVAMYPDVIAGPLSGGPFGSPPQPAGIGDQMTFYDAETGAFVLGGSGF